MKYFFSLTPDSLSPAAPFLWSLFWDHHLGSRCHTTVCWFWPSDSRKASANSRAAQIYFCVMLLKYSKSHNSEHLLLHTRNHSPCCSFLLVAIWSLLQCLTSAVMKVITFTIKCGNFPSQTKMLYEYQRNKDLFHLRN